MGKRKFASRGMKNLCLVETSRNSAKIRLAKERLRGIDLPSRKGDLTNCTPLHFPSTAPKQ